MSHLHEEDFEGMDSSQNGVEDLQSVIKVRYFWFPLETQYFIHY